MTYVLMVWTIVACAAYQCKEDWRQVIEFDSLQAKVLCEDAGKTLFADRKYLCVKTK